MKIGILGGTFNPVHTGHLVLAQECWHALELDKVVFVPAYLPPHKDIEDEIQVADRLNMVRLALEGDARFEISTYEIDKGGPSYSVDTVEHFRHIYGKDAGLYFLTGGDSLPELSSWKDMEKILEAVNFVAATRPGWDTAAGPYDNRLIRINIPAVGVSSTLVRKRVKNREPIDFLVPRKVLGYIRNKGLYRENRVL